MFHKYDCIYIDSIVIYTVLPNERRFLCAAIQFPTLYFMSPKDISLTISSLVEISESDFVIQNSSSFFLMGRNGNSISSRCRKKWSYLRKFLCYYGAWFSVYSFSHTQTMQSNISSRWHIHDIKNFLVFLHHNHINSNIICILHLIGLILYAIPNSCSFCFVSNLQ